MGVHFLLNHRRTGEKKAHLLCLVYVRTSPSVLVTTLMGEDINWELVTAIGVLLHCEYYI